MFFEEWVKSLAQFICTIGITWGVIIGYELYCRDKDFSDINYTFTGKIALCTSIFIWIFLWAFS